MNYDFLTLVPPLRHSGNKIVDVDPFNDDTPEYIVANEGDNVELKCPVVGYPVPRITWIQLKYAGQYVDEILPNNNTTLVIFHILLHTAHISQYMYVFDNCVPSL